MSSPPPSPAATPRPPAAEDSSGSPPAVARPTLSAAARAMQQPFQWRGGPLPSFTATSSRGSVPHLTPDNIVQHTRISAVHVGLEDFIAARAPQSPILRIPTRPHQFLAYPDSVHLVLSARRPNPVPVTASWDDKVEIQSVDGRTVLPIDLFVDAVKHFKLRQEDIVISIPDLTDSPGTKRLAKMIDRTRRWLTLLLQSNPECKIFASIPPVPPSRAPALLNDYMTFLATQSSRISGIAVYDIFPDYPITQRLPHELSQLPLILIPSPLTPHEILSAILTDQVTLFTAGGMISTMSDLGIALNFHLTQPPPQKNLPLGIDLCSPAYERKMTPLIDSCKCFTCTHHHAAYIHHLLRCHEMTAWVLLQMYLHPPSAPSLTNRHNLHVLDRFFAEIRLSIQQGRFLADALAFDEAYSSTEMLDLLGQRGPRVRGHHTALRREPKKRKLPVAKNGDRGRAAVWSGGEVIEREGKRKHWLRLADGVPGGEVVPDGDGGEVFPDGDGGEVVPDGVDVKE